MTDFLRLPVGDDFPETLNVVIEIPAGDTNKYEYDKRLQVFRLDRNLSSPVHYPGDYGFIPQTKAHDGDPLDVLVLTDSPSFSGCVFEARPIGLLEMDDQGVNDQKVLAVPQRNPRYESLKSYRDIHSGVLREIEHFFAIYKDLECRNCTSIKGWMEAQEAKAVVAESHDRFLRANQIETRTV